ncbi:hypothetical protein GWI33_015765 [Rhynchophorus ferrugineus]|uniref:Uncharacterized protein n=1 Tax=Rhynchophorus ferrugineus TaxID=354439 RepID=A0A834M5N2_RHYFE|nr:hypothetical protein GWI33_015765 [Rhynchophorus ferrugineus]
MSAANLLEAIGQMFGASKLLRKKEFEGRVWKAVVIIKTSSRHIGVIASVSARMSHFRSGADLLEAFENITLHSNEQSYGKHNVNSASDNKLNNTSVAGYPSTECIQSKRECLQCGGEEEKREGDQERDSYSRRGTQSETSTNLFQVSPAYHVSFLLAMRSLITCIYTLIAMMDSGSPIRLTNEHLPVEPLSAVCQEDKWYSCIKGS